jgi:hypothetical protein
MKKDYLFTLLFLACLPAAMLAQSQFDQSLVGSMGGEISAASGDVSFLQSMGSIAGTFVHGPGGRFVQGFAQESYCGDCKTLTSVVNPELEASLRFFPNPAYDLLHVEGDTEVLHRYQIFDAQGKLVGERALRWPAHQPERPLGRPVRLPLPDPKRAVGGQHENRETINENSLSITAKYPTQ